MTTIREETSTTRPLTSETSSEPLEARFQVVVGIIAIGIGLFAISMPLLTGVLVSVWLGLLLVVLGIARAEAIKHRSIVDLGVVAAELLRASVYLVVGILILLVPFGQARLSVILAIPLLLDGIGLLSSAVRAESNPVQSVLIGTALISISVLLVLNWPADTALLIGVLFGVGLILMGITAVYKGMTNFNSRQK